MADSDEPKDTSAVEAVQETVNAGAEAPPPAAAAANPILPEEPVPVVTTEPVGDTKDMKASAAVAVAAAAVDEPGAIWEPADPDVLSGRGASVNAHQGNKKFRALCFSRKHLFEGGNHAAKRRVAKDIVSYTMTEFGTRFLKRKQDKGPWYEMNAEQALLKACQVMRDYKRPDRLAQRELLAANGKKHNRATSTPMEEVASIPVPDAPLEENPYGVHDHDILSGRGAFVNGHVGNGRLRELALARKTPFDSGTYTEKRTLATEVVTIIRSLDPPGRFLKKLNPAMVKPPDSLDESGRALFAEGWEELSDEKAIHKACQVMRDIDRADRKDRIERGKIRKLKKEGKGPEGSLLVQESPGSMEMLANITAGAAAQVIEATQVQVVEDAVEEAMDKALEAAAGNLQEEAAKSMEV